MVARQTLNEMKKKDRKNNTANLSNTSHPSSLSTNANNRKMHEQLSQAIDNDHEIIDNVNHDDTDNNHE